MKPGSTAELRVWRDSKERALNVHVEELKDEPERARIAEREEKKTDESQLGMAVRPLTPKEKQRVDTAGSIVVEQVSDAAARAGVQPGDIILGVNGKPVESVEELHGAAEGSQRTVALLIERGDAQVFIPMRTG
jgi:serine protease Do